MDKVYFNGKIYIEKDSFAQAMLISDGKVKATGTDRELLGSFQGERIDLAGHTVVPGFNDSHLHLAWTGELKSLVDLTKAQSISEVIDLGKQFLMENPATRVLVGKGWNETLFPQTERRHLSRQDLDRITTEIPVIFDRICLHIASANSRALERLAAGGGSTVKADGMVLNARGEATGVFTENGVHKLHTLIPPRTTKVLKNHLVKGMDYALSRGITSVQSTDLIMSEDQRIFDILAELHEEGGLKLRYRHQLNFAGIEDFRAYLETEFQRKTYDETFYTKGGVKLFKDGSLGGRTAWLTTDYRDKPGERGMETISRDEMMGFLKLATQYGIQVVTHAIGDAAVDAVIDAYEEVFAGSGNPLRHGIVHCQITSRPQLEKIASLTIPVFAQPVFLLSDIAMVEQRVGRELAETSYAFASLLKLGVSLSLSSDAPVEDCDPFLNLHAAVNRITLDRTPQGGFFPEERLTVDEALDAYTEGSAWNEGQEHFKGRLKPGFAADFVILDQDLFTVPVLSIRDIRVLETVVAGRSVYKHSTEEA